MESVKGRVGETDDENRISPKWRMIYRPGSYTGALPFRIGAIPAGM
jgi:hypothetical protein